MTLTRWRWKRSLPPGFTDEWWYAALVPRVDVDRKGETMVKAPFTLPELKAAFAEEHLGGSLCDAVLDADIDIRATPYVSADGFTVIRIHMRLPNRTKRANPQLWAAREPIDMCLKEAGVRLLILTSSKVMSTKKDK